MSFGRSRARIHLAYVDELLTSFNVHPQKSIQFVFQRLLVTCGDGWDSVVIHTADSLLSCAGVVDLFKDDQPMTINEQQAVQLLGLIVKFATDEQRGRSEREIRGADALFSAIVDRVSEHFLEFARQSDGQAKQFEGLVWRTLLMGSSTAQQCAVLSCFTVGALHQLLHSLSEEPFVTFFDTYSVANSRCSLRTDYLLRIVIRAIEGRPPGIEAPAIRAVINNVKREVESGQRKMSEAQSIPPLLLSVLAKESGVPAIVEATGLARTVQNVAENHMFNPQTQDITVGLHESGRIALCSIINQPSLTSSQATLRGHLSKAGFDTCEFITPESIAEFIIKMVVAESNEEWNGDVFALTCNDINSNIDWKLVFKYLDTESFTILSRASLQLLVKTLTAGCSSKNDPFPIELLFEKWNHPNGLLSLLKQITGNPDVFCLGDHKHRSVDTTCLIATGEEDSQIFANWRCLELTETLLDIASIPGLLGRVIDIFKQAFDVCPEILLLSLFQVQMVLQPFAIELIRDVVNEILNVLPTPSVAEVLHAGWNLETVNTTIIRNCIVKIILSTYNQHPNDSSRLSNILEISHGLDNTCLARLLGNEDFPFVIDLACLASSKDYLDIQKWLEDKHSMYTNEFIDALNSTILRRSPTSLGRLDISSNPLPEDIFIVLVHFVQKKSGEEPVKRLADILEKYPHLRVKKIMKESGRSSSVSSTGRAPLPGFSQHPARPMNINFPNNAAQSFNPLASQMQSQPNQGNPIGLSSMFGTNAFGGSQELIRPSQVNYQPNPTRAFPDLMPQGNTAAPLANFSRNQPTQPVRQPERQTATSTSSWPVPGVPGAVPGSRPPGPPTPSQQMDFRAQLPPTGAQTDFQARPTQPDADLSQMTFSDDIQEEANSYFEQIYSPAGLLTVHDLIEKLKKFKASNVARDQKVLSCVVKNLFEEYRFFVDYPDRELKTTAEVYGGIIREGIISNLHFATAVRKVIESLSADTTSKLYTFGIVSLDHCRNKLCAYPKVCSMIAQLENFQRFPPRLQEFIHAGVRGEHPPASSLEGRATPPVWQQPPRTGSADGSRQGSIPVNRTGNSVLSYTNVDTLVNATEQEGAEVDQPAEVIVDKMSFLFNNLSQTNLTAKKEEVLSLIHEQGEPFVRWLAQYIVMKRVSIEQNFQPLYNTFVQSVDHPLLDLHIKRETFRNIRILLRSDKRQAASNYSDRQLLKNLGMWLGSITIARSKPILIHELDLKSLLMEAYYKGQQELLFVVPFIAKILFSCSKTQIFSASCAWIRAILKILAELHNEPDLKINLKFEIEVLCKELCVELQSLPMEGVLKDTDRLLRVQQQLSELKLLARPDVLPSSSPVPSQIRLAAEALPTPGNETKPGTPAHEGEQTPSQVEASQQGHFAYHDINVVSYEGLAPHLQIKASLPLFQLHPQVKQVVRPALTLAIKELIGPVAERAQKIAMTVTENLISKDFALDPDEKNLKTSAFHMMRAMTAGMAMITCRDPLATTMLGYLTNSFQTALRTANANPEHVKMIDEAAQVITHDNVELATNFIVKTACEKAALEMEKRLDTLECQKRISARRDGTKFTNESVEAIQATLPARISIQNGSTKKDLLDIYAQFSSRICGFKPTISEEPEPEALRAISVPESEKQCEQLTHQLNVIIKEIVTTMSIHPNPTNKAFVAVGAIRDLLSHLSMNPRDQNAVHNCISKSVEHLLHAFHVDPSTKNHLDVEWPRRLRDLFVGVNRVLLGWLTITDIARRITSTIIALNVDYKWNVEAMEVLLKHNLLQTAVLDQHIAIKMNSGSNLEATIFAQRFFRALSNGGDAAKCTLLKEAFPSTFDQLLKVHQMQSSTRIPVPGELAGGLDSPIPADIGIGAERPEGEIGQKVVEGILREWISLCYTPMAQRSPQEALSQMIHTMHEHGVLSTDDKVTAFFRMCTEMCVDVTLRMLKQDPGNSFHQSTIIRQRCYYTLDAYVKLIALMIRFSDGTQAQTKITLLKKVLSIVSSVLHCDHEVRRNEFNPMPYHRILISLFNELTTTDANSPLDTIQWSILEAFGQALFMLQPRRCPGFAFAWLDIVGHRNVIGKLLGGSAEASEQTKMTAMYTQLIICHLKFLAPFLRNIHLPKSIAVLYKGTLRVLLVILHDFPELLCEFHYVICDTIPPNCVQLRNLVLSAYPRNMRLPDPFALGFKQVDGIPDMAQEPKSNLSMTTIIPETIRVQLDEYLGNRTAVDFLTALPGLLQISQTPGSKYNTTVMNAVVLYVGIRAIENLHQRRQPINIHSIAHTSFMDVFQNLAVQLCTEGRYLLFNAIANQLRYPNAHTHYFSCVFLFLFLNSDCDAIQEQITRILFERLVALRPHPWGLLITFIELIKNPVYNFWKYDFTRCAPEIERLFQNVANTCVPANRPAADAPRA